MSFQLTQKVTYEYTFRDLEIRPLVDMQPVAEEQNIFQAWASKVLLEDKKDRNMDKEEPQLIAEAEKGGEIGIGNTYKLTYYNPEMHKVEVLEASSAIKTKDVAQQMIEESVGRHSTYPLYSFIATPLIRKEIVPWKLEEILNEREYGTPPRGGSGGAIKVTPREVKSEIVAIKTREKLMKETIVEVVTRKEKSEEELEMEIIALEETVEAIKKGGNLGNTLSRLPPLTRARFIAALRKLKLDKRVIIRLLLEDIKFLKEVKKKLQKLSLQELLSLIQALRKLKKK